jgi:hypothetical protein
VEKQGKITFSTPSFHPCFSSSIFLPASQPLKLKMRMRRKEIRLEIEKKREKAGV